MAEMRRIFVAEPGELIVDVAQAAFEWARYYRRRAYFVHNDTLAYAEPYDCDRYDAVHRWDAQRER